MNEKVNFDEIKKMREKEYSVSIYWITDKLLYVKINGEEYEGLTPEEVIQRFGTNYNLMQEFRNLLKYRTDINAEQILQDNQSVKKEIIDLFMELIQENNIFEGQISIQEIKSRLEKNIDSIYIVDDSYREGVAGWYNGNSKNIYIKSGKPEDLKEFILSGNIKSILDNDLETICHEAIHALSPRGIQVSKEDGQVFGRSINEGIVQFLTNELLSERGKSFSSTYSEEVKSTRTLLGIYGNKVIDAYLKGDITSIIQNRESMTELLSYILYSDYILALYGAGKTEMLTDLRKKRDEQEIKLINKEGIDLSRFIEYLIEIPYGVDKNIVKDSMKKYIQDEEEGYKEKFVKYVKLAKTRNVRNAILEAIAEESQRKNNGRICLNDFAQLHSIDDDDGRVYHLTKLYLDRNDNDLATFCEEVANIYDILEKDVGDYSTRLDLSYFLERAIHMQYPECPSIEEYDEWQEKYGEIIEMKETIIRRITGGGEFEAPSEKEEIKQNIIDLKNTDYYQTQNGKWIVINSNNGNIVYAGGLYSTSTIEEDIELPQELQREDKTRGVHFTSDDSGEKEVFISALDENGRYILRGYSVNEQGEYIEIEIESGRNFLDDTTEMDRSIMVGTSNVRIGGIKSAMDKMSAVLKSNEKGEKSERND